MLENPSSPDAAQSAAARQAAEQAPAADQSPAAGAPLNTAAVARTAGGQQGFAAPLPIEKLNDSELAARFREQRTALEQSGCFEAGSLRADADEELRAPFADYCEGRAVLAARFGRIAAEVLQLDSRVFTAEMRARLRDMKSELPDVPGKFKAWCVISLMQAATLIYSPRKTARSIARRLVLQEQLGGPAEQCEALELGADLSASLTERRMLHR